MNLLPIAVFVVAYYLWTTTTTPLTPGEKSFTLYYMASCGYCRRMMPEFNKLGSSVNGVVIRKVEASRNDEMDVDGFPTMVYRDGQGGVTIYKGARTYKEIRDYIRNNTQTI